MLESVGEQSMEAETGGGNHVTTEGSAGCTGDGVVIKFEDMMSALKEVRPSAMKEVTLEVPKVSCLLGVLIKRIHTRLFFKLK